MEHNAAAPSLLPYLDSAGAPLFLRVPLLTGDPAALERLRCPFQVVIDSDPLTRLYEAHISSDGEATLTRLFLLVQRDQYRIGSQDLWPITNRTVDDFWQETFSAYQGQKSWKRPFLLGHQVDNAGRIIPCRPLLFCKRTGSFFHLPCPACDQELELCTDDELLTQVGLSPYSTSLRRYLFCPACLAGGKIPELYVYERAQETSPVLKDRHELFQAFTRLIENPSLATGLPCLTCAERGGCYGPDQQALANLVPFSFYPFYLLAFEAASLPALEFAALIGGAAPGQLESSLAARGEEGRMRCIRRLGERLTQGGSFLFAGEEVWFLEVLYLKLSLLGDLARLVFSDFFSDRRPDFGFPIDQVWIELSAVGGLLPSFWNFRAGPFALLVHQREVPQAPPAYGLHLLGLGWMAVLLANGGQDISQVYRTLSEEMAAPSAASSPLSAAGTFAPENIFWNSGTRIVRDEYRPFWEKALGLGWSLLRAAVGSDPRWSKETFLAQVDELRREVRTGLFQARGVPAEDTNEALHQILVGISRRWLPVLERAAEAPAKTVPKGEPDKRKAMEEIPATVMISPEERAKLATLPKPEMPPKPAKEPPRPAPQPPPRPLAKAKPEEEEIPVTVMISPEERAKLATPLKPEMPPKPAKEPPPRPPAKPKPEEEEIPVTVMISPEERAKLATPPKPEMPPKPAKEPPRPAPQPPPRPPAKAKPEEEEIPVTVMISPEERAKLAAPPKPEMPPKPAKEPPRPAPQPPPRPLAKAKPEEEEIPVTVMISPGAIPKMPEPLQGASQAPGGAPEKTPGKKAKEPPSDDFAVKTVFISPERRKDKDSEEER